MSIAFEMLIDTWGWGWDGKCLVLLMIGVSLLVVGAVMFGIFYLIDTVGRPRYTKPCKVTDKKFVPAHSTTTMIYNPATKTTMPSTTHYPDAWFVSVEFVDGWGDITGVSEDLFNQTNEGDELQGTFKVGRLSKQCYLVSVAKPEPSVQIRI